ncbi:hypothetical protein TSAR_016414 [Trichomalopsis sarcophagae]|uniref:U6 snRNA-associated Sm-like protein LSm2 n=1 Tax=Trichomalopsis sarcophagae TaxID=543379 RepID=A0A232F2W9_9HYME|nr:hypothetical protein TSAR_016414 [Trichomalopsis sarcophagae]
MFYSFFKSLVGKDVVVELKNDLSICGTLHSVDQYLNIKLTDISVTDPDKYPHMLSVKNCFIRGSVVRYVQLPGDEVDTQLLQDAARKEAATQSRYQVIYLQIHHKKATLLKSFELSTQGPLITGQCTSLVKPLNQGLFFPCTDPPA